MNKLSVSAGSRGLGRFGSHSGASADIHICQWQRFFFIWALMRSEVEIAVVGT